MTPVAITLLFLLCIAIIFIAYERKEHWRKQMEKNQQIRELMERIASLKKALKDNGIF